MSFGIRAVLERMFDDKYLPDMGHSVSLPHTYQKLTQYLLRKRTSLRVLTLAARMPCQSAPSWVPDYSQKLEYVSPQIDAVWDSKLYLKYYSGDIDVLVVKGFIVGHITWVGPGRIRSAKDLAAYPVLTGTWTPMKTTLGRGDCPHDSKVGDKVALIAGVHLPLIVRDQGDFVRIVGNAWLEPEIMEGRTWKAYEKKRRREWLREHASETDSQILSEPDPAVYLPDILIS
jgi:hypothetical protein